MHTHNILYGAHACRNGKSMDHYQDIATLYILNQKCMILIIIEKSKRRDVYSGCDTLTLHNLVCAFFGTAIPTLSFNFIEFLFIYLHLCLNISYTK